MLCRFAAVRCLMAGILAVFCSFVFAQETPDIAKHERWVTSLAFSSDGTLLASVGGESLQYRPGDVKLWDVKSGKLVASLEGHPSNVWAVAFSPDGKTLVTTGYDGKVMVWDTAEKKALATLEKHKGWCRAVAYHPSGSHFATGGEDGNVVVWDRATLKEAKEFKAHDSAVYALAFSPQDGNTLASGSTDKTAKLWDWQNAKEIKKARRSHRRRLGRSVRTRWQPAGHRRCGSQNQTLESNGRRSRNSRRTQRLDHRPFVFPPIPRFWPVRITAAM